MSRLIKCGVVPPDEVTSRVIMYKSHGDNKTLFERFKKRALDTNHKLFVMIADECHYAATQSGPHNTYVNDPDLHAASNFVLLGVSATPYNCLTSGSRVKRE
ncbi:unnamed protein product, partial [Scytosiphon promiscuus]